MASLHSKEQKDIRINTVNQFTDHLLFEDFLYNWNLCYIFSYIKHFLMSTRRI